MTRRVYCAKPNTTLAELTRELTQLRASGAPVVNDDGLLVGFISLTDVAQAAVEGDAIKSRPVSDLMRRRVFDIDQAATVVTAVQKFKEYRVHRLVVTCNDRVVGILSLIDLMDAILERTGYPGVL